MSLFGQNPFKEFRATLNEKAQKDEGNAFTKALNAAKEKGEDSFVVAGKKYDVKTEMAKLSKEDNTNDKSDDGEGLDKVQPKALKKKFNNRKDKDIDNDGDVDSSDEYLHNRRKTVSKKVDENDDEDMDDKNGDEKENGDDKKKAKKRNGNGAKDDVEMNPKMESRIRKSLRDVLEANQNPNKDKAEKPEDALKGKGAKDMMEPAKKAEVDDTEEKGHDDASKAGKVTKAAKGRNGSDNVRTGDQKVVSPGTPMKKTMEAYASMYEQKDGGSGPDNNYKYNVYGYTGERGDEGHRAMLAKAKKRNVKVSTGRKNPNTGSSTDGKHLILRGNKKDVDHIIDNHIGRDE